MLALLVLEPVWEPEVQGKLLSGAGLIPQTAGRAVKIRVKTVCWLTNGEK